MTPGDPKKRARMNQWIGNLNWYFYPEMIYHVRTSGWSIPSLEFPATT